MLSVKSINRNVLLTLLLFITGCQTPMLVFPGKALTGEIADEKEFSALKSPALMRLEVTPNNPYSVIIRTTFIDEQLYIDAAPARKWGKSCT
jgi:hypothetical protein